jgi:DNA-binding response OmpR family regulator
METSVSRRKILIVEDEYFIADDCAFAVKSAGFDVCGPFASLEALDFNIAEIAGALLDVNVHDAAIFPLLDQLMESKIPIALYTGYEPKYLPAKYSRVPVLTKPRKCTEVVQVLCAEVRASRSTPHHDVDRDQHAGNAARVVVGVDDRALAIAKQQLVGLPQRQQF